MEKLVSLDKTNKYEVKLQSIIEECDLHMEQTVDSTYIHGIIMNLFQQKCLNRRIALWGAGRSNSMTSHASVILTKYSSLLRGMVCLIDSCEELQGRLFMDYRIIAPQDILEYNIEVIIVASRSSADSIKKSIKEYAHECEVIDIYQELRDRGIDLIYNFYEEKSSYRDLYEQRIAYEEETDYEAKGIKLKSLIGTYLKIRDFYYGLKYLDIYIDNKYADSNKMQKAREGIKAIIWEVRDINRARKGDINIHFIDALRAIDVYKETEKKGEFIYLPQYFEKGIYYKNCYATAATTYESIISILCEENSFSRNVYEDNFIFRFEEVPLLKQAKNNLMDINLLSSEEWRIIHDDRRINYINQIHMSQKLWTMFCQNAVSVNKQFNFLYYPWELHFPLVCGYHRKAPVTMNFPDVGVKDMSGFIEEQFVDCMNYVEKLFGFYECFYSDDCYRIIFSDHSQVVYDKEKFVPYYMYYKDKERAVHCILSISGPGIKQEVNSEYISMIDFSKIVASKIFEHKEYQSSTDLIRYQYYNIHNKVLREIAKDKGFEDYIDGIIVLMNEEYMYVCTATGREEVYEQKGQGRDITGTPKGRQITAEFRKYHDIKFPEFLSVHFK